MTKLRKSYARYLLAIVSPVLLLSYHIFSLLTLFECIVFLLCYSLFVVVPIWCGACVGSLFCSVCLDAQSCLPVVVLLLLTFCLLLLPLWESVIVLCFVVRFFMSILVLQSS